MALSGSNFEIFVPTGAKHRTDSCEIWRERVLLYAIFHPIGAGVAMWGPKIDNFTKLVQNFLIQIPLEHIPCTIFMKFSGLWRVSYVWGYILKFGKISLTRRILVLWAFRLLRVWLPPNF